MKKISALVLLFTILFTACSNRSVHYTEGMMPREIKTTQMLNIDGQIIQKTEPTKGCGPLHFCK